LLVEGMNRCAPFIARDGGRSVLKALLRRLIEPVIDIRDPIQMASDRITARASEVTA
jgi:hypothetical protein